MIQKYVYFLWRENQTCFEATWKKIPRRSNWPHCVSLRKFKQYIIYYLFEPPYLSLHLIYFFCYYCSCNNFGQCDILARDFDFGPNPCPDTERYLEASYICVLGSENDHQMSPTYEGTYVLVREMSWTFFLLQFLYFLTK